jgi:hypothetical protein
MQRIAEGRHLADRRAPGTALKVQHFLRLDRQPRETFHVRRPEPGTTRLREFLRIARNRLA